MKTFFLVFFVLIVISATAQYRFDNVAFKTVYWEELCNTLNQNPGHLILDVRSKGEHFDTSVSKTLNLGHLDGALNIDIREIGSRLKEIEAYKSKPVFVYCSHSQRSRRVSKLLADSGFVNVFNINGGISNLRMFEYSEMCNLLTTKLPYQLLSPKKLAGKQATSYYIVDVRPDSSFYGIALQERKNAYGKLSTSVNIPLNILEQRLASLPKDKTILLVDETGNESIAAAEILSKNGFANLAVLFNGLDAYISEIPEIERDGWVNYVPYHTLSAVGLDELSKNRMPVVIDVRTKDEFNNAAKENFRNIGNIKNAINIPFSSLNDDITALPVDKETPLVVYSMSTTNEIFDFAKKLMFQGYKNVNILLGGLFNIRWRAANLKGHEHLKEWVVNVPPDNQ